MSKYLNISPITKHLILANFVIWIISTAAYHISDFDFSRYLGLHYFSSPDYIPTQIVTYMFMHDTHGLAHIFFNMFSLLMFGTILEQTFGGKRFLFDYMSTGIGAAIIQLLIMHFEIASIASSLPAEAVETVYREGYSVLSQAKNYVEPGMAEMNLLINTPIVGASGAVFGILLAFGMIYPNEILSIFFIIDIKAKYAVIGYGVLELIFGVSGVMSNIAHFAHLGGMLVGLLIILIWRKKGIIGGY